MHTFNTLLSTNDGAYDPDQNKCQISATTRRLESDSFLQNCGDIQTSYFGY